MLFKLLELLARDVGAPGGQRRRDDAGADAVHADARLAELERDRSRQVDHRGLRDAVEVR